VIDPIPPQESQYTSNKILAHNIYNGQHVGDDDIINIQLLYNSNWSMEPDLWNSNFGHIFLYSSLKHLPSDTSCIKTSFT